MSCRPSKGDQPKAVTSAPAESQQRAPFLHPRKDGALVTAYWISVYQEIFDQGKVDAYARLGSTRAGGGGRNVRCSRAARADV